MPFVSLWPPNQCLDQRGSTQKRRDAFILIALRRRRSPDGHASMASFYNWAQEEALASKKMPDKDGKRKQGQQPKRAEHGAAAPTRPPTGPADNPRQQTTTHQQPSRPHVCQMAPNMARWPRTTVEHGRTASELIKHVVPKEAHAQAQACELITLWWIPREDETVQREDHTHLPPMKHRDPIF